MSARATRKAPSIASFRTKLLVAMMLVIVAITALGLFLAQRKVQIEAELDLQQDFRNELATVHGVQEMRHAALAERCRELVLRPRIHAALEDNALDLLYPSAKDELRDIISSRNKSENSGALQARFYRFLDSTGAVISPRDGADVGELTPAEEAQLALAGGLPDTQQIGYLLRKGGAETVDEIIAMPISSSDTGEVIAALVFGFEPVAVGSDHSQTEIRSGIWTQGRLLLPSLAPEERIALDKQLAPIQSNAESSVGVKIGGAPNLLFYKQLNPGSAYPAGYEVAVYPLANAFARQQQIRWHVLVAGAALLVIGLIASHLISSRLSAPVEELAVTSEQNRTQRARAEAALESTSVELQRSARFSADASHQLKTPVTVLRAGIEELLARDDFTPEVYHELSALLHQTYRITGVVDDLLLLSRMDAGRLQIKFGAVNLTKLIEEWLDDLSALPDELDIDLRTDIPGDLYVSGERRYITLIVQNLLENARKYNQPGGHIGVAAHEEGEFVVLTVENTGKQIPEGAREHIFERFHRGGVGENVPGHGLGLNLARELARLHGGDLRLTRSDAAGTEFEARFRTAPSAAPVPARTA